MDRKTLMAVIVTALVVALLTSIITVKLTGNAIFGSGFDPKRLVKANSCDADKTCEVNSLALDGVRIDGSNGLLEIYPDNKRVLMRGNLVIGEYLNPTPYFDYDNKLTVRGLGVVNPTGLESNAFVCVDALGEFYRSNSICTGTTGNNPPIVKITAPVSGSVFKTPFEDTTKITLSAEATDNDGKITKVEFYIDGVLKETDTTSPYYKFNFGVEGIGKHSILAKAYDDKGAVSLSDLVIYSLE
ncbi:Ig-like domain-containing protein [Candidatus Pacearchaeota archaeon]|nr:Ig-like domain-containing protein [Candidatus Pacearchaeota archaeon]